MIKFRSALTAVINRHEALRSCFSVEPGTGGEIQGVYATARFLLEHHENSGKTLAAELSRIKKHVFDVGRGDTIKVVILSQPETQHSIIIAYHHLVMDGLSLVVFLSAVILAIDALPRTVNGKRGRRVLDSLPIPRSYHSGGEMANEQQRHCPLTPTEIGAKQAWEQVLSLMRAPILGAETDFFRVGGNSLLLQLQAALRETTSTRVSVRELFRSSSLGAMAKLVDQQSSKSATDDMEVDWSAEIESLVREVAVSPSLPMSSSHSLRTQTHVGSSSGMSILLTGATGFLGTQFLSVLAASSEVRVIHCVATRADSSSGQQRHITSVQSPKIREYPGDLCLPLLELSEMQFSQLAADCDAIVHNGADVSFLKTYESLRQPNVGFHANPLAVFAQQESAAPLSPASLSSLPPPSSAARTEGYTASKWVAVPRIAPGKMEGLLDVCDVEEVARNVVRVVLENSGSDWAEGRGDDGKREVVYVHHCGENKIDPKGDGFVAFLEAIDWRRSKSGDLGDGKMVGGVEQEGAGSFID
ncbi:male sterility protein-domain-containing protein [Cladorrhinum sp. PSN332]|nr:male sterility protein-domain-containing protein [Cladorrhinum sp. PSN332]